jgi:uncharacterized protein YgbK (DUF1537 family)
MTLTILADDLTGACDSGTLFAGKAPVAVTIWPRTATDADVRVLDTESRRLAPAAAGARVRSAASAPAGRWFKKIDSTLRGPIGAEVEALMVAVHAPGAVVCPAFPAQGRVVRDRELLVHGRPVAQTAVAFDPTFPLPSQTRRDGTSSVVELLRPQLDVPVAWIPLDQVRAGTSALAGRLSRLAGTVAVADAETNDDLATIVDAALEGEPPTLLAGAAGLAAPLARRLGLLAEPPPMPRAPRWLVVVGSRHPASRRQAEAARRAGLRVLMTPEDGVDDVAAAAALAREAQALLAVERFDLVAVTGGDTALALVEALGAERIELVGAPRPGLALGRLRAPAAPDLHLLTKAGGFGAPDLFVTLAREAAA